MGTTWPTSEKIACNFWIIIKTTPYHQKPVRQDDKVLPFTYFHVFFRGMNQKVHTTSKYLLKTMLKSEKFPNVLPTYLKSAPTWKRR